MKKINSMTARFGGVVTYKDQTTSSFHTQLEQGKIWSQDQPGSLETTRQIRWFDPIAYPYWNAVLVAIQKLPFIASFDWDDSCCFPVVQRVITDMVARLDIIMTFNDQTTYPVAVIITGTQDNIRVEVPYLASAAANLADYKVQLRNMLLNIMDQVVLS